MKSNYVFLWNAGDVGTGSRAQVSVPVQTLTDLQGTVPIATQLSLSPSTVTACSQTPSSLLPAPFILSVHYHCGATERHCCLEQKSPLMSFITMETPDVAVVWVFLLSMYKSLSLQNMIHSISCGYFNTGPCAAAHAEVVLHRCSLTGLNKALLRSDSLYAMISRRCLHFT